MGYTILWQRKTCKVALKSEENGTMTENKTNYNDKDVEEYENAVGEPTYLPSKYAHKGYTDTFYDEKEESGAGSFLLGAVVGGVIGAATALFLAPKTGKEMRDDLSTQAGQIKEKSIELSSIAKEKATEYGSVAKEKASEYGEIAKDKANEFAATAKVKTEEVTKTIQEQSGQIADKVKSINNNGSAAGEEPEDLVEDIKEKLDEGEEKVTEMAEALKEEVVKKAEENKKV